MSTVSITCILLAIQFGVGFTVPAPYFRNTGNNLVAEAGTASEFCGRLKLIEVGKDTESSVIDMNLTTNLTQNDLNLEKIQNDDITRNYRIWKVEIFHSNAVVRICSEVDHTCKTFFKSEILQENPANYIKHLNQAICNFKNPECIAPKDCSRVNLKENEYARLYRDANCNECTFPSISITDKSCITEVRRPTIESIKIKKGWEIRGHFKKNSNPDYEVFKQSGSIEVKHTKFVCIES